MLKLPTVKITRRVRIGVGKPVVAYFAPSRLAKLNFNGANADQPYSDTVIPFAAWTPLTNWEIKVFSLNVIWLVKVVPSEANV